MSRTRKVWSGVATTLLLLLTLLTGTALAAGDPVQINFTLEGCRNDGSIILPIGGKYVCPDSAYTTGNLGKGWNELDLVPHRITLNNNSGATESYSFVVAGDHKNGAGTGTGWDVIGSDAMTAPTLNTALSSSGCSAVAVTWNDQVITPPGGGVGGADQTIYRLVTINSQPNNATCVYDYYQRLALGAHNFSGSSLQSNLWNQHLTSTGIGQKRLSLPVGEILPQELDKDMSASQGSDHMWNITKSPSPATLSFENTCDTGQPRSAQVAITVSWERLPAVPGGPITVLTHVYATNPAARVITVNVTDVIRSGTTALDTATSGPINVPANTANYLVLTHQTTVPDGTTSLNDVATATYTDLVTGVPVPGNTTATASAVVQLTGPEKNQTATINDVESITGTGFTFSVDSFSGATGAFDAGYVAGTHTVGPVSWTSASQSGSGSVTFNKTVYVSWPLIIGGNLHDVANLTGSDGFSASAEADVTLSANATVVLTINKNVTNVLQGSETATFDFTVKDASDIVVAAPSITFAAGETTKSVVVSGLMPGAYTVSETAPAGWTTQPDKSVSITLPSCTGSVTFDNPVIAASAKVRKISDPAGSEAGWVFNLLKDGVQIATTTTTGAGFVDFGVQLGEGNYTVVEVAKPGFDQTGSTGCSFTVDLPRDPNPPFECVFTNTQRAKIIVNKVTDPAGDPQSFGFTTTGSGYTPFSLTHGQSNDSGWLVPGNYSVAETVPSGWDLTGSVCGGAAYTPGSTITLDPGETVNCTFTNTKRGRIIIDKVTEPAGHAQLFDFTLTGGPSALNTAFQLADATAPYNSGNIKPGSGYAASETEPFGWKLTGASCSDGSPVSNISVQPGETVTCTFTNSLVPAKVQVKKVTVPAGFEANWTFTLNKDGTPVATATTTGGGPIDFNYDLYSGNYTIVETTQPGWSSDGDVGCSFTVNLPADADQMFSCTFTNTYQPSISFSKTGDALSKIGDLVTYHLALHNTSPSGGPAGVPNLVCSIDDPIIGVSESGRSLAPGASITVHVPFTIPPGASDPFVNTASASCTYPGLSDVVASGTDSHSTNLFQPSVKLTKTGPAYAVVGDIVTYNVTIENTSSADSPALIGNSFADSFVAGVVPPAACSPLAPGASCNFSYDYTVLMTDPDPLVNTATVHYHPDGFLNDIWDDDTWILDVKYPAKAQVKKVTAPAGFEANWKFDLKKAGVTVATATTTGAGFLDFNYDLYSGNYTIVETSQPGWVSDGGVGCAFTVNLPADDGQMFSCTFTNTYQPSVDLDKTGDTLSKIGDPVDYTITLDNTSLSGPAGAPNLQCSIDDPTIGFSNSVSLAAGESYTANVPFTIPAGASDPFVNTASVSCTYEGLSTPATANASWSTNLFQPSVDITKTGPSDVLVGTDATYNVTIKNTSSADSPALVLDSFGDSLVPGVVPPAACSPLVPGASCSFSYNYTVPVGAPDPLENTATVHYNPQGFPNDIWDADSHSLNVVLPAQARVQKVTVPAGFEAGWTFNLKDAQNNTLATATTTGVGYIDFGVDLLSGTYHIGELSQPGWAGSAGAGCSFTVSLPADDDQTFSCTFTNTYHPAVNLTKTGDMLGKVSDPIDYTITLDNTSPIPGPAGAPALVCKVTDGLIGFDSGDVTLVPGQVGAFSTSYIVQIGDPDPFVNTASVSCTYPSLNDVVATDSASHSTNLFQPSVDITKTGPAYAKEGDTITYNITINSTSSADSPNLILDTFGDTLVAGVTLPAACNELAPGGSCSTSYTYVVPAGAPEVLNNTATVHYHPNGFPNDVTRSDPHIVDIIHPSYTVTKVCKVGIEPVPQEGPALFQITFVNTGDADLVITSDEVTPSTFDLLVDETKTFEVMVNGPFTGQATVPNTVNANAVLNSRYGVSYTEGKTASDYCDVGGRVSVLKLTQGLVNPNMAWDFSLYAGPHQTTSSAFLSSPLASDGTSGKVDGILTFNNYNLNPNRTYTICERNAPASWSSMWKVDTNNDGVVDTIITPYNPNSQDSPPADTGNRCFDFGANTNYPILAGGKLVFEVNNTQPGGEPRTIGFWKNWNICTGGNQAQVAEANGGPEAGWYILENLLPQQEPYMWIGDLKVLNCTQGVRVLSSQEVSTGKNKASDAAYNLASQLLAAKLNESAGAEMCPVAHQAILDGQALLEGTTKVNGKAINFTGVGDYLTSKVKGDLLTLRNMALALANTLDRYNNGNVCP